LSRNIETQRTRVAWADAVGSHVFATSFHDGYFNQPATPFTQAAVTACAMRPRPGSPRSFMDGVAALRKSLDATGKQIAISADEWGLGPPWRADAHGTYWASARAAVPAHARLPTHTAAGRRAGGGCPCDDHASTWCPARVTSMVI
jgi:hypothetical protein